MREAHPEGEGHGWAESQLRRTAQLDVPKERPEGEPQEGANQKIRFRQFFGGMAFGQCKTCLT